MKDFLTAVFLIAVIIVLIGIGPLLTIWSLNTIFLLGIAYNLKTWFATLFLTSIVAARKFTNKD